jgi:polyferredoxin
MVFILLLLLMPSLDILRYDVAAKELYLFGSQWSLGLDEAFYSAPGDFGAGYVAIKFFTHAVLPWLLVLAVFPLLGFVLGRSFCGWACPEGTLFEFADLLTQKVLGRRSIYRAASGECLLTPANRAVWGTLALLYVLVVPPLFGVMLTGYFIAPSRIWNELAVWDLSTGLKAGIIGVSIYMVVTFVFVRHAMCKYVCAAGLMQMLFGWISPGALRLNFHKADYSRCTDCRRCEQACFMDLKPRSGKKDISCVNCAECLVACEKELGKGCGLFSLDFGIREKGEHSCPEDGSLRETEKPVEQVEPCRDGACR